MITHSAQETIELAKEITKFLKPNSIIALTGNLGSGKTTFTKGIAHGLGVNNPNYVNSPSFTLIREYKGNMNLFHIDLYRLDNLIDIAELGLQEYFGAGGVTVIEWAQKMQDLLPKDYLEIQISIIENDFRKIEFKAYGEKYKEIKKYYESISSRHINKYN